jgi:hypothetical protein
MKVFIGGSRRISKIAPELLPRLRNIVNAGGIILIGDANGSDKLIQECLMQWQYDKVIVFAAGDKYRNNLGNWQTKYVDCDTNKKDFYFYACKDLAMSLEADYGLMLWDGKSKGTINNALNLIRNHKKVLLYLAKSREFKSISILDDLRAILRTCDLPTKEKLITELKIIEFEDELPQRPLKYA